MDQNDRSTELNLKHNSSPDSPFSDCNPNSDIPTFKFENEDRGEVSENRRNGSATSNNADVAEDASQHLTVPSKDPRMLRSSSLKIGKSSADGASSDKKIVRFADAMGLDLVDVKVFTNDGSLPNIPPCAFNDLMVNLNNDKKPLLSQDPTQDKYVLVPQFEQPGSGANFINRVKDQKVCLENVIILDLQVTGIVRISNLHYKKVIIVRYTTDNWNSVLEQPAIYVEGSSDTVTDKFKFTIHPRHMKPGDKLIFVLKYEVLDQEFWDNNNSNNYTLLCKAKRSK
ncbi:glycogen-binding subunit 76A-like [Argiope bruennichi]|uniref:Glycogen-binding subunit 76A like protein n=1 Tax=Argiope bruennichi TaxID=94029 RepID=A0A8T0F2T4_ARGBR|nr:glycogen-binding subunit 76A-like [Argiope bruennichi]KAF8782842.1 Glycogen-binding subunit 76A like protein [Argiope bruennichi]